VAPIAPTRRPIAAVGVKARRHMRRQLGAAFDDRWMDLAISW